MDFENGPIQNHQCNNCFFHEIHKTLETRYHCNLFTKHVPQNSSICLNHATAQEVAHVIINYSPFSIN